MWRGSANREQIRCFGSFPDRFVGVPIRRLLLRRSRARGDTLAAPGELVRCINCRVSNFVANPGTLLHVSGCLIYVANGSVSFSWRIPGSALDRPRTCLTDLVTDSSPGHSRRNRYRALRAGAGSDVF
jgi:hypothetical protein